MYIIMEFVFAGKQKGDDLQPTKYLQRIGHTYSQRAANLEFCQVDI